ncbi:coiled-coil domain-containing protein 137 isoform X2 [Ornithorhynchus anatinus]|uniref:coiled-coil domain-containing protein 137 isoform X2 n=1 Tax=Ornithorhynchus anatinus TaxID=9258 RepID=UPI0010A8E383|nr:coiled-coil domain-containing protein 137 isoform X2 [Ornithorhynchus anatinus]
MGRAGRGRGRPAGRGGAAGLRPGPGPGPGPRPPGPRHPLSRGEEEEKKKVNSRPRNPDDQGIPFRLREIMKSREEMKKPSSKKKRKAAREALRHKLEVEERGPAPAIPVPKFKQRKGESERQYISRMERETERVFFLTKNQLDRQPETEDPEAGAEKDKSQRKKEFQRRRLEKARRRKEEKAEVQLEKELFQDPVKFGEVATQPPELTAKPRKSIGRDKPGQKQLLLKTLLAPGSRPQPPPVSLARQRIVEEERARVVQAYRQLKKLRQGQRPEPPRGRRKEPR